jgi:hypothetical protein
MKHAGRAVDTGPGGQPLVGRKRSQHRRGSVVIRMNPFNGLGQPLIPSNASDLRRAGMRARSNLVATGVADTTN